MHDTFVNLDGRIVPIDDARIPVLDRGFLFGDQVYEVLRTFQGRPLFFPEHMARLRASADALELEIGVAPPSLRALVVETAAVVPSAEKQIRLIVTRGVGDLSMSGPHGPSTVLVIARPLMTPPGLLYRDGCALATFTRTSANMGPNSPSAKTGDKRLAVRAERFARAAGAHEALLVAGDAPQEAGGLVLEGASSTFFAVVGGMLHTPPLGAGIVAGITRAKVLEVARVPVREAPFDRAFLDTCDEAFITSTSRGVLPVSRIDGRVLGPPGPVTVALMADYAACMARAVATDA